jgi:hypothetical protein
LINYSQREQIKDIYPAFGSAIFMGLIMYVVGLIPMQSLLLQIAFQASAGILVYYLVSIMASTTEIKEIKSIIVDTLNHIRMR